MTISSGLREELRKVDNIKVYPIVAPEGVKPPFVVYRKSRGQYTRVLSGESVQCEETYDVLVIAETYEESEEYSHKIRKVLLNTLFKEMGTTGIRINDIEIEFTGQEYIYQPNAIKQALLVTISYKEENNNGI